MDGASHVDLDAAYRPFAEDILDGLEEVFVYMILLVAACQSTCSSGIACLLEKLMGVVIIQPHRFCVLLSRFP